MAKKRTFKTTKKNYYYKRKKNYFLNTTKNYQYLKISFSRYIVVLIL